MSVPNGSQSPYPVQLFQTLLDPTGSLDRWSREYGDTFRLGGDRVPTTICFSHPQDIRTIFNAPPDTIGYSQQSELVKSLLGDGSFIFLPEKEHQRQRKLILPNFHQQSLESCGQNIINVTRKIIGNLIAGSPFDVRQIMKQISLEVILNEIFGREDGLSRDRLRQTIINLFETFDSPVLASYLVAARFFPGLLELEFGIWQTVNHLKQKLDSQIFAEIAWQRKHQDESRQDLFSLLIKSSDENGQSMSDREICDAIITLIFAGFETVAAAVSWMLYWVYYIPGVKAKLLNELSDYKGELKPIEIARLPYLSAVCNETLRISPPAVSTFTRTVKKPIEIGKYYLEVGTEINVSIYLAHRRESVYPKPEDFKPERFLARQFSPYEFLPFGGGQCRCLGASLTLYEMKLVLVAIMSNFELELIDPRPIKPSRHGIVMIPPGLKMKVI